MMAPTGKELTDRASACNVLVELIRRGEAATLDQCRAAVNDDDDLWLHLFMALQGHVSALGYAWDLARSLLNQPPIDDNHWFRRVEFTGNGRMVKILIGGARVQAEVGHEARGIAMAALQDWARRAEKAVHPVAVP